MTDVGHIITPGSDTKQIMWTDPDPPTYEWSAVNHGLVFRREGAGQLDWGPTGIAVKDGTTFMVTPDYIGIPEGPGVTVMEPSEHTLAELLTYSTAGNTGLPAFGPRGDELTNYFGDDQGYIPEANIGDAAGSRPQKITSTSIRWTSGPQDMGVRKIKNVQAIEVETSLTCPIYVGIIARTSPMQPFNEKPTWGVIRHPVQRAGFNLGGIEFMFLLYASGYESGNIGNMTIYYKLMDVTALHGRPTLIRGAQ